MARSTRGFCNGATPVTRRRKLMQQATHAWRTSYTAVKARRALNSSHVQPRLHKRKVERGAREGKAN
eukprot:12605824-Alexandrium_andersonii.AAC.1